MAKGFSKNNPLDKLSGTAPIPVVPYEEPKVAVEPKKEPAEVRSLKRRVKSADLKQKQKKPRQ